MQKEIRMITIINLLIKKVDSGKDSDSGDDKEEVEQDEQEDKDEGKEEEGDSEEDAKEYLTNGQLRKMTKNQLFNLLATHNKTVVTNKSRCLKGKLINIIVEGKFNRRPT